ncbi:MAG: tRNA pseudouridine(38-40) synthase TruA [Bdellovibrionales bacterium]|nr:tRNA pseudouridine(38-40) synthase TruA [Bdellovibrionales bacterium]
MPQRTVRIDLAYDGTNYFGWQRQNHQITVQEKIEKAISKIAGEKITVVAASRTDSGVHARQQVASFSLEQSNIPTHAFVSGANSLLPLDIRVFASKEVSLKFHANRDASHKVYRYFVWNHPKENVFLRHYAWMIRKPLEWSEMRYAANQMLGKHDFSSFRTGEPSTRTSIRKIDRIRFFKVMPHLYCLEFQGNGFLRHMVRNLVGLLVDIGLEKRNASAVKSILKAKRRTASGTSAPSQGLVLWRVSYL